MEKPEVKESKKEKFRRLEQLREIFVVVFVLLGIVIIQFPLPNPQASYPIEFNRVGIYTTAFLLVIFAFVWHRLLPIKVKEETKFFLETLIYILGIHFVVAFTGGTYSYFTFLYFLPVLNTAANLSFRSGLWTAIFTTIVMAVHLVVPFSRGDYTNAFSLFFLNLFGVWLVMALGRFLATEVGVILKRQEEFELEQLRQIDKLKDEFVFIIAHELRSPITAIRGYLELITTDTNQKLEGNMQVLTQKSFSTANKLANLISLLLEVARIETGKIRFYLQKIDLKSSIDLVINELKKEAVQKEIEITVNLHEENYVLIDKERLEEILNIIIENAIVFTPEYGKILINTQNTEKHVLLTVSDTGVGIPEEMKPKIFEKFYTEDNLSGEIQVKGYGIGLYVAKQLMLRMSGDVTFESIVGKGTTFTIHLPKYWSWTK